MIQLKNIFLPDRFIKGECPKCGAPDQYGDNCENCGASYNPADLKNPRSVVSGATPIDKDSEHYFFKLGDFEEMLKYWTQAGHLQKEVSQQAQRMVRIRPAGLGHFPRRTLLRIRDSGSPGQILLCLAGRPHRLHGAAFKNLCEQRDDLDFDEILESAIPSAELYHFIGKDIIYFHTLFWPAMLHGADFRTPTSIFIHGFLTVDGQKMSKSRGTFIKASTYLEHLNPEYLRYYFAAKLGSGVDDIDLNLEDFSQRVNSDLVGKFVNIASRCAGFITKRFDGKLSEDLSEPILFNEFAQAGHDIADSLSRNANTHAPCGRSWRWPTRRTNISMRSSPGSSQKRKARIRNCRISAAWA